MKAKGFSKGCKQEVQRYQQESAQDYRLNHRLYKACKDDVSKVCADACDLDTGEVCGGRVSWRQSCV
jgi:Golgi apparatus protein 1